MTTKNVTKFRTPQELEQRKAFIRGEQEAELTSFADMSKMNADELADRMESIYNQSQLMIWMLCMHIRDRFGSDKDLGEFINNLRIKNPYHPLCVVTQQARNRYVHAGRLAAKLKITDFDTVGISPTAFYAIASPKNKNIADKVFNQVKRKNLPVDEIFRIIEQESAIPEADEQALEVMDYDKPRSVLRSVKVFGNVAEDAIIEGVSELIEQEVAKHEVVAPVILTEPEATSVSYNKLFMQAKEEPIEVTINDEHVKHDWRIDGDRRKRHDEKYAHSPLHEISADDLLLELAARREGKPFDDIKSDLMMFVERYDTSFTELEKLFDALKKWAKTMQA